MTEDLSTDMRMLNHADLRVGKFSTFRIREIRSLRMIRNDEPLSGAPIPDR